MQLSFFLNLWNYPAAPHPANTSACVSPVLSLRQVKKINGFSTLAFFRKFKESRI